VWRSCVRHAYTNQIIEIMPTQTTLDPIKELAKSVDIKTVNALLSNTELKDFEMNKSTIINIAEWCLNGESDTEIRKRLDLNKHQWAILVTICPTLLIIMKDSRALADIVLAGSLFQTAVGGKRIKKQVPVKYKVYDENGKVEREDYKIVEIEEELPPNPLLLKYLAEHKLSEKLGENSNNKDNDYKKLVDSLKPEELAVIEAMKKASDINGGK